MYIAASKSPFSPMEILSMPIPNDSRITGG